MRKDFKSWAAGAERAKGLEKARARAAANASEEGAEGATPPSDDQGVAERYDEQLIFGNHTLESTPMTQQQGSAEVPAARANRTKPSTAGSGARRASTSAGGIGIPIAQQAAEAKITAAASASLAEAEESPAKSVAHVEDLEID